MAAETVRWTWKFRMLPQLESDIEQRLREQAEAEAIRVFGRTCTTCCSPRRRDSA